ncbi:hypothetical protein DERP_005184 [Dermatophagoides pteronyssinus]|uniref:Uncharacterized protein n=1 Tax=Dermatophagoides pteronyssinus TaxID=6956 RepID=A0ABQ8JLW0_DERPT|nr:hypothetical protein DERP_005184 [Dermatophagoides pteronyssinus]
MNDNDGHQKTMNKKIIRSAKSAKSVVGNDRNRLYNFRLNVCGSQKISQLRLQFILQPFRILFEQFPQQIKELQTMIDDFNYIDDSNNGGGSQTTTKNCNQSLNKDHMDKQKNSTKITTTTINATIMKATNMSKMFLLNQKSKQQQQQHCCCNYNYHQIPLFLTYNGYIDSDQDLMILLKQLEKYEDFYLDWSKSFIRSIQLCRPSQFANNNNRLSSSQPNSQQNIDIETKDYCLTCVDEFAESIRESSNYHQILMQRFRMITKMQRNPHLIDYQTHFDIGIRQIYYDLMLKHRQLYYYYQLTYDLIAKNSQKFISY